MPYKPLPAYQRVGSGHQDPTEVKKGTINLVTRVFLREINETGMKSRTEGSMYLLRAINHHDAQEDLHAHPHVHRDAGEILLMICCKRKYVED